MKKVKFFKIKPENKKSYYNYALWIGEPGVKGSSLRLADQIHDLFTNYMGPSLALDDAKSEEIGKYDLIKEYTDFDAFRNENIEHVL